MNDLIADKLEDIKQRHPSMYSPSNTLLSEIEDAFEKLYEAGSQETAKEIVEEIEKIYMVQTSHCNSHVPCANCALKAQKLFEGRVLSLIRSKYLTQEDKPTNTKE